MRLVRPEVMRAMRDFWSTKELSRTGTFATEIYAASYAQSAQAQELYAFLKTMETYKAVLDEESTLLFSTSSELFRYLDNAEGKK